MLYVAYLQLLRKNGSWAFAPGTYGFKVRSTISLWYTSGAAPRDVKVPTPRA